MHRPGPHPPFMLSLCVWLLNYWCLCIADFGLCVVPGECSSKADGGIYLTQKVGLYCSSCPHNARPSQWIWPQHCRTERTFSHTQECMFSFTTEIIYRMALRAVLQSIVTSEPAHSKHTLLFFFDNSFYNLFSKSALIINTGLSNQANRQRRRFLTFWFVY